MKRIIVALMLTFGFVVGSAYITGCNNSTPSEKTAEKTTTDAAAADTTKAD